MRAPPTIAVAASARHRDGAELALLDGPRVGNLDVRMPLGWAGLAAKIADRPKDLAVPGAWPPAQRPRPPSELVC
jgi:hypothetical protein